MVLIPDYVRDPKGAAPMSIIVLIAADLALPSALEASWLRDLPPVRQAELARWPDRAARHRSLLGTRLLLEGLRRLGIRGASLASLRHTPAGRPTLALPVHFSLSHCEGRVLCALSSQGPVGIDVEALGSLVAAEFPSYLSPAERSWAGHDAARFYAIWTRKEAVVKAAGRRGLAELAEVETRGADAGASFAGQAWQTTTIPAGAGYIAHLACSPGRELPQSLTVEHVSANVLEHGACSRALEPALFP
jgi:4'-phosphopantetheinyl transferase